MVEKRRKRAVAESSQVAKVGQLEVEAPSLGDSSTLNEEFQKAFGHFMVLAEISRLSEK